MHLDPAVRTTITTNCAFLACSLAAPAFRQTPYRPSTLRIHSTVPLLAPKLSSRRIPRLHLRRHRAVLPKQTSASVASSAPTSTPRASLRRATPSPLPLCFLDHSLLSHLYPALHRVTGTLGILQLPLPLPQPWAAPQVIRNGCDCTSPLCRQ